LVRLLVPEAVALALIAGLALLAAAFGAGHFLELADFTESGAVGFTHAAADATTAWLVEFGAGLCFFHLSCGAVCGIVHDELEPAFGEVDRGDLDGDEIAEVEAASGTDIDECSGFGVELPDREEIVTGDITREIFRFDEAVGEELVDLDKDSAGVEARDDAAVALADVFIEELENEKVAEFALGGFGVVLAEAGVSADFDKILFGGTGIGSTEIAAEVPLLGIGLRAALAVVGVAEIFGEGAMDSEVGVAADRAGEVGVGLAGEGVVADECGAVLGAGEGAEYGHMYGACGGRASGGVEEALEFLA